jgi:hypothetical protein
MHLKQAPLAALRPHRSTAMLDVLLLALGLGLFVISVGYVYACDRL